MHIVAHLRGVRRAVGAGCGTLTGFTPGAGRRSGGGARVAHAGHTSLCPRLQMLRAFGLTPRLQMLRAFGLTPGLQMLRAFGLTPGLQMLRAFRAPGPSGAGYQKCWPIRAETNSCPSKMSSRHGENLQKLGHTHGAREAAEGGGG